MSKAPRPARWNSRSRSWAGQDRVFGQRQSTFVLPGQGGLAGRAGVREPELALAAGPQVRHRAEHLGITSPALRRITMSPMRTPLRLISSALCKVARSTVEPLTLTGSITANGVTRPVRPTLTWMSSNRVVTSSGGYLNAMAHRGARLVEPSRRCSAIWSIFTTTPSISYGGSCRCSS